MRRGLRLALAMLLAAAMPAAAAERYVFVVSGASGGGKYAVLQQQWREDLVLVLKNRFGVATANVVVLDEDGGVASRATADNVRHVLADLQRRVKEDDLLLVVLFGHGTIDGADGKFNLVGPDLTAREWSDLLDPVAGRIAIVNTTESSFPFIEQLSHKGRVVMTATDSAVQRFATMFPEYFVRALADPASDSDKDGRVSLWEAFGYASTAVRSYYEQRGQLSTERPLLDDDGDGRGREFQAPGDDGVLARRLFLDDERPLPEVDAALAELYRRRDDLQRQVEDLRARKLLLTDEAYQAEMESLLLQLARVSAEIRKRS